MMEMVIVMACLASRLRLDFAGERDPVPVMRITLQPDTDMPMTIRRR